MVNWGAFTLFLYIIMRMSGFVLFSPLYGRSGMPAIVQSGFILALSTAAYSFYDGPVPGPRSLFSLALGLLLEMGVGLFLGLLMRFFFFIADQAGEVVDTQMGMSMARTYDATSQASMTITANLLNIMVLLMFFAADGHLTLLRMILTSGQLVPFGTASFGQAAAERGVELFAQCAVLSVKLTLPILAAELLGQVGMGILMKAIPQINVFAINIELKVLVGFFMLFMLLTPMSEFLLDVERTMLEELQLALGLLGP